MKWSLASRAQFALLILLTVTLAARCSSAPPKPDVVAELQKLKIPTIPKTFTEAQKADIERMWDGRGQWFVRNGCFSCHAVSVFEVKGLTPIGPDLSNAVDDVKTRFGRTLEEFWKEPQGTMQMVLGQLIVLTPEQKDVGLKELRAAYAEYLKQKGSKTGAH
jgi:cytochrome c1